MSFTLPIASPEVICRPLPDGAVLFSARDEVYFGLNAVGVRVWELLAAPDASFDGVCAAIHATYPEVAIETIRTDVRELLDEMTAAGLVVARSGSSASASTVDVASARASTPVAAPR